MTDSFGNNISGGTFFRTVIQGRDITLVLPPQASPAMAGLPAASGAFTGRHTELDVLLELLAPRNASKSDSTEALGVQASELALVAVVAGMGGVGKTELALQAAHTALSRDWFAGGVLFADMFGYDLERRRTVDQTAAGFVRALGIPSEHVPDDSQELLRLYQSALAAFAAQGRPVLIIVDNVSQHEQAASLLPANPACRAIVTSRHTLGRLNARLIDLETLPPIEAVSLLRNAVDLSRPGDSRITDCPDDAKRIAEQCGFQPLALRIVAAMLADQPKKPPAAIVSELESLPDRLAELSYDDEAVTKVFDLSYHHLSPEQARLFRLISLNPGSDISTAAAAAVATLPERDTRKLLGALARAHLIEVGISYGRWRMHDLIRLYSTNCRNAEADNDGYSSAITQLLGYYLETMRAANSHLALVPDGPRSTCFADSGEAQAWFDAESGNMDACAGIASSDAAHLALADDLLREKNKEQLFRLQRMWQDPFVHARLNFILEVSFLDQADQADAYNRFGKYAWDELQFRDATWAYQEAARIFRDIGDRHGEGASLSNLGAALIGAAMQGERSFEEAIRTFREAIQIFRETGDSQSEGMTLSNLGIALREDGQLEDAHAAWHIAAQVFRETGDKDRLSVVESLMEADGKE